MLVFRANFYACEIHFFISLVPSKIGEKNHFTFWSFEIFLYNFRDILTVRTSRWFLIIRYSHFYNISRPLIYNVRSDNSFLGAICHNR